MVDERGGRELAVVLHLDQRAGVDCRRLGDVELRAGADGEQRAEQPAGADDQIVFVRSSVPASKSRSCGLTRLPTDSRPPPMRVAAVSVAVPATVRWRPRPTTNSPPRACSRTPPVPIVKSPVSFSSPQPNWTAPEAGEVRRGVGSAADRQHVGGEAAAGDGEQAVEDAMVVVPSTSIEAPAPSVTVGPRRAGADGDAAGTGQVDRAGVKLDGRDAGQIGALNEPPLKASTPVVKAPPATASEPPVVR